VRFGERGLDREILTVDNHTDGVYMYLTLRERDGARADDVYQLLRRNGGNRSGISISCIDNLGDVHADQFSWYHSFGNVVSRPFSRMWQDGSDPVMAILRDRKPHLKGRCGACKFLEICNGNLRARAYAHTGDWLEADPGCYLPDSAIGL
jgi:radical SAM protein with 4Fe4S-binding SPASM domain